VSNQVEEGAVHRLVLLGADEYVIEDEPLGYLLIAGYHLKLDTIQVLVQDAEVLLLPLVRLLVRLLLPPAVLAASHPTTKAMRQKQYKSIVLLSVVQMD